MLSTILLVTMGTKIETHGHNKHIRIVYIPLLYGKSPKM